MSLLRFVLAISLSTSVVELEVEPVAPVAPVAPVELVPPTGEEEDARLLPLDDPDADGGGDIVIDVP